MPSSDSICLVTFAVLTYNSEATIQKCLNSILAQTVPSSLYTILVIDNGSTDSTTDYVSNFVITLLPFPELSIPALRNKALELSKTPLVAFVDSDCEICKTWLEAGLHWFSDPSVAIAGFRYALPETPSFHEKYWHGIPRSRVGFNDLIPAGNMLVSRSVLTGLGGFDERLVTAEDVQILYLARANGYKAVSDPSMRSVHHGNPKTLLQFYRKEVWYGIGGPPPFIRLLKFDKPFWAAHIAIFLLAITVSGLLLGQSALLFTGLSAFLLLSLFSAIDRRFKKHIRGSFWYMLVCYPVYFAARIRSLAHIYGILPLRHLR